MTPQPLEAEPGLACPTLSTRARALLRSEALRVSVQKQILEHSSRAASTAAASRFTMAAVAQQRLARRVVRPDPGMQQDANDQVQMGAKVKDT